MLKKHKCGLVVGKFCPLHTGHEYLLDTATNLCEKLIIISYTSERYYSPIDRHLWLSSLYPDAIVITPEKGMPNDNAYDVLHREYCANILDSLGIYPDIVIGSEKYIPGLAAFLRGYFGKPCKSKILDLNRTQFSVSGSFLRNNTDLIPTWTSTVVQTKLAKRILIIGGECTGKSTLTLALQTKHSDWGLVSEYGREYGENNQYSYESMLHIATVQLQREEAAMQLYTDFVICDTSALVTKFYSKEWYHMVNPLLSFMAERTYDYVFLATRDFPYFNDGTRSGEEFSKKQEDWYKSELAQIQPYYILSGTIDERIAFIEQVISG